MNKTTIPKPENDVLAAYFDSAKKIADFVVEEKPIDETQGPLGRSILLIATEILDARGDEYETPPHVADVRENLERVFRDAIDAIGVEEYIDCATLMLYRLIFGRYTHEDFRYLYRWSLSEIRQQNAIEEWLRRALVVLFLCSEEEKENRYILDSVRDWIEYLGAPLWHVTQFETVLEDFGLDSSILQEREMQFGDTLRRHSQYLREAIEGKSYREVREATKKWLPGRLSQKVFDIYKQTIVQAASERISRGMKIEDARNELEGIMREHGFLSEGGTLLPVKLEILDSPPTPSAIDTKTLELIPKELRIDLLPTIAYSEPTDKIEILFLGGPHIGRSGILIKTKNGGVLFDFGLSVANQRIPQWVPELEMIDNVLITHAHLDHVGGLPILYDRYDGKWCSVGPTAAISLSLLEDALKVGTPTPPRGNEPLERLSRFTKRNIEKVRQNYVRLESSKSYEVGPGIVVTPIEACHIHGSVAYLIDIEGKKILYTGDFNLDKSLLFRGANLPTDADVTIFDGTYWGREDFDRDKVKEQVSAATREYGPVIIPAFAVGRSQEMLVLLEELNITESRNVMVAGLAEYITKLLGIEGNWHGMKKNKLHLDKDDILVAGNGMMAGGLSKAHFREHRRNEDAAVILCGYLAPRTPGWNLLNGFEPHDCHVEYARLSAHTSASNLEGYVKDCSGKKIMVHTPVEKFPHGVLRPGYKERITLDV